LLWWRCLRCDGLRVGGGGVCLRASVTSFSLSSLATAPRRAHVCAARCKFTCGAQRMFTRVWHRPPWRAAGSDGHARGSWPAHCLWVQRRGRWSVFAMQESECYMCVVQVMGLENVKRVAARLADMLSGADSGRTSMGICIGTCSTAVTSGRLCSRQPHCYPLGQALF